MVVQNIAPTIAFEALAGDADGATVTITTTDPGPQDALSLKVEFSVNGASWPGHTAYVEAGESTLSIPALPVGTYLLLAKVTDTDGADPDDIAGSQREPGATGTCA